MIGGHAALAFAYEDWARDNPVRAFVYAWAAVVLVWLILDWLGNPNRGRFRPQGPRKGRGVRGRARAWRAQRDHRDAEVRETLRAAYGKSSLRLTWSNIDETAATAHDEARLSPVPQLLELGAADEHALPTLETETIDIAWESAENPDIDLTEIEAEVEEVGQVDIDLTGAPEPEDERLFDLADIDLTDAGTDQDDDVVIDLTDSGTDQDDDVVIDLTDAGTDQDDDVIIDLTELEADEDRELIGVPVPVATPLFDADAAGTGNGRDDGSNGRGNGRDGRRTTTIGWRSGDDPRAVTMAGVVPTTATLKARSWKNRALAQPGVGGENQRRMTKGRPPRRWNPITREQETAMVDLEDDSLGVTWELTGVDPFLGSDDSARAT